VHVHSGVQPVPSKAPEYFLWKAPELAIYERPIPSPRSSSHPRPGSSIRPDTNQKVQREVPAESTEVQARVLPAELECVKAQQDLWVESSACSLAIDSKTVRSGLVYSW
jgi:hypothetical protein